MGEQELRNEIEIYKKQHTNATNELERIIEGKGKLDDLESELKTKESIILTAQKENERLLKNIEEERGLFQEEIIEKDNLILAIRNENVILKEAEKKYLLIIQELNFQGNLACY